MKKKNNHKYQTAARKKAAPPPPVQEYCSVENCDLHANYGSAGRLLCSWHFSETPAAIGMYINNIKSISGWNEES